MREKTESEAKYGDIIGLSHPVSQVHPQMSVHERAAQFSPFAALTGHEAAIRETARLTEGQIELEEDRKEELDEKLSGLLQPGSVCPEVTVCYFEPDARKEGGTYRTVSGRVKRADAYEHQLVFEDGRRIAVEQIISIEDGKET